MSPHGVRLSGAPDAPPMTGCLSANRAFAVKLLRNGIVAVPEVFGAGCFALFRAEERGQPGGNARSGDVGEQYRRLDAPDSSPKLADRQRRTEERKALREPWKFGGYQSSTKQLWPQRGPLYRVDGPSGFTQVAEESWKDH